MDAKAFFSTRNQESSSSKDARGPKRRIPICNSEKLKQPCSSSSSSSSSFSSSDSSEGTQVLETQEIVCTPIVPFIQEEQMTHHIQCYNFHQNEIHLLKTIVENHVIPLVQEGKKSYDNTTMWEYVRKEYNNQARNAGFEKHKRGPCKCIEPKIPSSFVDLPTDFSGSTNKRSHDSMSANSPSTEIRVARALKKLRELGHLTGPTVKIASILYSNLINSGQKVVVEAFLDEDDTEKQLATMEEDLHSFDSFARI